MLVQLPYETDEELRAIHSMWEAGLLRVCSGHPWGDVALCRGWPGFNNPLSDYFRSSAAHVYVKLEE